MGKPRGRRQSRSEGSRGHLLGWERQGRAGRAGRAGQGRAGRAGQGLAGVNRVAGSGPSAVSSCVVRGPGALGQGKYWLVGERGRGRLGVQTQDCWIICNMIFLSP